MRAPTADRGGVLLHRCHNRLPHNGVALCQTCISRCVFGNIEAGGTAAEEPAEVRGDPAAEAAS